MHQPLADRRRRPRRSTDHDSARSGPSSSFVGAHQLHGTLSSPRTVPGACHRRRPRPAGGSSSPDRRRPSRLGHRCASATPVGVDMAWTRQSGILHVHRTSPVCAGSGSLRFRQYLGPDSADPTPASSGPAGRRCEDAPALRRHLVSTGKSLAAPGGRRRKPEAPPPVVYNGRWRILLVGDPRSAYLSGHGERRARGRYG